MSAKARWLPRLRSGNGEGTSLRSRTFAAGSIHASPIAKSLKVWSKRAHSISLAAIAPSFSPASRKLSRLQLRLIVIAPPVRSRSSAIFRGRQSCRGVLITCAGPNARNVFRKRVTGFYVTGHPLDAYASVFATGKYQAIASLGELADRSTFTIAGAIAEVDRKFTKKEGKPFAVVFLEDLTGTVEVVLWNETYVPVAKRSSLASYRDSRYLDKRDDTVRATAQKVKLLKPEPTAEPSEETNGAESNGNGNGSLRVREEGRR